MIARKKVVYGDLNARQKEAFNFQKLSAILADHGYLTIKLSDDWNGADFLAVPFDGSPTLKVQLKPRLFFSQKYAGKDLYLAFPHEGGWYLAPYDQLADEVEKVSPYRHNDDWTKNGKYTFPAPSKALELMLKQYLL